MTATFVLWLNLRNDPATGNAMLACMCSRQLIAAARELRVTIRPVEALAGAKALRLALIRNIRHACLSDVYQVAS